MYSYGPSYMAGQKQDDLLEHTYSSYVRIRDVVLNTCQRRWTIGKSGERGSWISVPVARHDDDYHAVPWFPGSDLILPYGLYGSIYSNLILLNIQPLHCNARDMSPHHLVLSSSPMVDLSHRPTLSCFLNCWWITMITNFLLYILYWLMKSLINSLSGSWIRKSVWW